MKTLIVTLVVGAILTLAGPSGAAQQGDHQMPGMAMDPCRDQLNQVIAAIDAASQRLDLARQTNSPSEMRAAMDALQLTLGPFKAQLGPCATPANAGGAAVTSSDLDITLTSQPNPPKIGNNRFEVNVKRPDGKPVADAQVSILFVMPAMPQMKMPETRNEMQLTSAGNGKYTGSGAVVMAGSWNVTVSVKQDGKEIGQKTFTLSAQ